MTNEADLIFARANVALAKSQRLIASWLPPRTQEELQNAKTSEDLDREEEELFKPMPELLGLGATPKEETDSVRKELSKDDVLRKRLFGKDFEKMFRKDGNGKKGGREVLRRGGSKPMPVEMKRETVDEDDDDEDEGRSAVGRSKQTGKVALEEEAQGSKAEASGEHEVPLQIVKRQRKRPSNYLDEVLDEKQRKKKKKAKRQV